MSDPIPIPGSKQSANANEESHQDESYFGTDGLSVPHAEEGFTSLGFASTAGSTPTTPSLLAGSDSVNGNTYDTDDFDQVPPLDRLTFFDFLENLALPQRIEKIQNSLAAQKERVRKQQERLKNSSQQARERVVDEWRRRVPPPDEQLQKYRRRMRKSVENLGARWTDSKNVTTREKVSFIAGVLNIFLSGYLIGAFPEYFHHWYTAQIAYFYPVRFYLYRKKGYHYFLADLCYYVNFLLLLSIWAFPQSKRLFISTFCLGLGNNALAIAMWRNSLVFHSFDKVTSLFIHIMPCVTLHVLVHLIPEELRARRFPAIHAIKTSTPDQPEHYGLKEMAIWSTVPYALWQLSYHLLITVRRREQIAKGRPTSFTWLRKSLANSWIGKLVLALPDGLQEPAFMLSQYCFSILTMLPAPIWFSFRWASATFLISLFTWCVYNGANYYIDVFGKRFQRELEQLKKDVATWQFSPELAPKSPTSSGIKGNHAHAGSGDFSLGVPAVAPNESSVNGRDGKVSGIVTSSGVEHLDGGMDGVIKRNSASL